MRCGPWDPRWWPSDPVLFSFHGFSSLLGLSNCVWHSDRGESPTLLTGLVGKKGREKGCDGMFRGLWGWSDGDLIQLRLCIREGGGWNLEGEMSELGLKG